MLERAMGRKGKEKMQPSNYERLADDNSSAVGGGGGGGGGRAPKGHVPVLVGRGPSTERFIVNVKLFNDPCMAALLEMAADELGDCGREGILRITCDAEHFRRVVSVISKSR